MIQNVVFFLNCKWEWERRKGVEDTEKKKEEKEDEGWMEGNRKGGSGEGGMEGYRKGGSGEGGTEENRKGEEREQSRIRIM